MLEGPEVRLLDEVLCLGPVVREPQGRVVEGVQVDERGLFELLAPRLPEVCSY
jgi:hypothetical protein